MDSTRHSLFRHGVIAAAASVATNLAVFAAGAATGVGYVVANGQSPRTVTAAQVIVMSATPILAATVAATVLRRRSMVRGLQVLGLAVTALSLGGPLSMGVGAGTKALLGAMHVIAGAFFVVVIEHALRDEAAPRGPRRNSRATPSPATA